jgi:uncharacterized protein (DUF58 family)
MRLPLVPAPALLGAIGISAAGTLAALIAGVDVGTCATIALAAATIIVVIATADVALTRRAWKLAKVRVERHLPAAFAIGVTRDIDVAFAVHGSQSWRIRFYDYADPTLATQRLPAALTLPASQVTTFAYGVTPTRRGDVSFEPADLRVRSRLRFWDLVERAGERETRRVYPDFAQVARYAWLAGDRRLAEIGIKTYRQRGEGTDFKQLAEYRIGDAVRHIDWKATQRIGKAIVRQFQNERDQCVMLLIDCGRRMRADDRAERIGAAHFDQVLNAVMLLSYVALKQGDAVGALTFGTPSGEERWFPPRKGSSTLNALMGELFAAQPTPTHTDYIAAAQDLLRRLRKRALVIVISNFRDEDASELGQALRLLRSRHLVLTASLRERIVRELMSKAPDSIEATLDIASAHLYEQSRRDAFNRIAARDALIVDAEPDRLGIELVNRYQAMKKAGMI